MKQVLQHARTGEIEVAEVPAPKLLPGCLLVRIGASLVSAGTERASSEFASSNIFQKAKARPDLVREVLKKARRDGLLSAIAAVHSRLDQPSALGYSSAGTVIEVGEGIADIEVGDCVACAGAGYAVHAEFACIPRLLAAKIPAEAQLRLEHAAFTTVGTVALHGVRTAEVQLGDVVAVIGLGLLGQLTVQILKAAGCIVLGMDIASDRAELAVRIGADAVTTSAAEFLDLCSQHSMAHGVDAVLITAETPSSDPVNLAGEIARSRAKVVAVGTVGMDIQRKLYYQKELDFRVSRSYGPGRYDSAYEQKGRDYPIGYVRWTETRNMEAFLRLLADGKLDLDPLITHRFPIERAREAYGLITGGTGERFLGVIITYGEQPAEARRLELLPKAAPIRGSGQEGISVGLLGAGSFASGTLLPAIRKIGGVKLTGVCAANGSHAKHVAEKFGFQHCTTDDDQIIHDLSTNTVVIATRHHLHGEQVLKALRAGKHVFCEKPLCLRWQELAEIARTYDRLPRDGRPLLMLGFNRRFAPMAVQLHAFVRQIGEPLALQYRVNAGYLPPDHWTNDPEQGGGRLIGEACHFIDFLTFLNGAPPIEVHTRTLANSGRYADDNFVIAVQFANGSQGTITYVANGDRSYSKERVEVFGGGAAAVLEDFRRLELARYGKKKIVRSRLRQDKGHRAEWQAFSAAVAAGKPSPIAFDDILLSTLATLCAAESRSSGQAVPVDPAALVNSISRGAE